VTESLIEELISDARVAHLATVDARGSPHVVPVCFVRRDGRVYIALDEKPKRLPPERLQRIRNIAANPNVQLLIDRYDEDWSRLAFVQLRGRASLLQPGAPEHASAVDALREKYTQYRAMSLAALPLIKIEVDRTVSWRAAP
jgi:coenzyme F420-0:L-glutamate ligase/coenzyme F420-1:gamma-L-glutamate ligase